MSASCKNRQKVILGVDTGVDDAQMIMLAFTDPVEVEVLAIICVAGNVSTSSVCHNTKRVLEVLHETQVPIYRGCEKSILGRTPEPNPQHIHGLDGLGANAEREQCSPDFVESEHGVQALVKFTMEHPGEVTIVWTAPLTTLALAIRIDPGVPARLGHVVIMGGNIEARGRVTPCAEFNFHFDPEGACICLKELAGKLTVVPYEVCLRTQLSWDWMDMLLCSETGKGKFIRSILSHAYRVMKDVLQKPAFTVCDPLALAVVMCPSVVVQTHIAPCTVELHGNYTRGQMVVDWHQQHSTSVSDMPLDIIMEFDPKKVKSLLNKTVR